MTKPKVSRRASLLNLRHCPTGAFCITTGWWGLAAGTALNSAATLRLGLMLAWNKMRAGTMAASLSGCRVRDAGLVRFGKERSRDTAAGREATVVTGVRGPTRFITWLAAPTAVAEPALRGRSIRSFSAMRGRR